MLTLNNKSFIAMLAEYGITQEAKPDVYAKCLEAFSRTWQHDVEVWRRVLESKGAVKLPRVPFLGDKFDPR